MSVTVANLVSNLLSIGDSSHLANLDTTRVTDAGSTSTVMIVSGLLVIAAFTLIGITVWFWRNTVPDPDALESLAFFEERVVDSAPDPHDDRPRRRQRVAEDGADSERRHASRRERPNRSSTDDRRRSDSQTEGERHRRFRGR